MDSRAGFFKTWTGATFKPSEFFARPAAERSRWPSMLFALAVGIAGAAVGNLLWALATRPSEAVSSVLGMVLFVALFTPLWLVATAAIVHLLLIAVRSPRLGFRETLGCLCHAQSPCLFGALPFIGSIVAGVWSLVTSTVGLRAVHRTTTAKAIFAVVGSAVISLLPIVVLRLAIVGSFKIPSRSMVPTVQLGDHLFVNKLAYALHAPRHGDVIAFPFPEHRDQDFLKRVVAVSGDRLEVIGGRPIINGQVVARCRVGTLSYDEGDGAFGRHEGEVYLEYLGETAHLAFYDAAMVSSGSRGACRTHADCGTGLRCDGESCGEYQGPYEVRSGEVFVMGDNRNNSHDSRSWFEGRGGGVPSASIHGRASWVWMGSAEGKVDDDRMGLDVMGTPRVTGPVEAQLGAGLAECLRTKAAR